MKYALSILLLLCCINTWADVGAPWGVKIVSLGNGETRHIKFNVITGETWWSKNTTWERIKEPEPITSSTYEFSVVSTGSDWRAIRIDKLTGQAWKNSFGEWVKFDSSNK